MSASINQSTNSGVEKKSFFCQFRAQYINDVSAMSQTGAALPSYVDDQFLELHYFACFSATSRRR
ncbi:unnamed protein product [Dovyalis caffra]|uniref:Uncharacterized protein n=1 Tax=Dovyalis caffra TaxID=77055 RepID=A0AAV1SFV6_9ROSI|nr:unnamed protein product [Dovyalis caffra]